MASKSIWIITFSIYFRLYVMHQNLTSFEKHLRDNDIWFSEEIHRYREVLLYRTRKIIPARFQ